MTEPKMALSAGKKTRAVIIGGSMGGLMTARVLSAYYQEVLIIEKDELPEEPIDRVGTPQGFHPHRFTPRSELILERLFPGFLEDLIANDAHTTLNKYLYQANHYGEIMIGPREERDVTCSRALMEWVIRQRVKKLENVRFITQSEVLNLRTNLEKTVVTGVEVRDRRSKQVQVYNADMVVDISGHRTKLSQWLEALGYEVPSPDRLLVDLAYSTRRYQVPVHLANHWDCVRIAGHPSTETYTGVFSIIENHVAEVLLYGLGGRYPTINADEYTAESKRLMNSKIAELISELEPITAPRGYRVPELTRQRFEQMDSWPTGLLVLGDAYCNVDPIFGQGITLAAIEVETLERCLQEQQKQPIMHFEQRVLQAIQDTIEPAWWLNCATDLNWPNVKYIGDPLKGIEFAQKYLELYLKHATVKQDISLYGLYWTVNSLLFSPQVILHPDMINLVMQDASTDEQQWFAQFTGGKSYMTQKQLDDILPSFAGATFVEFSPQGGMEE